MIFQFGTITNPFSKLAPGTDLAKSSCGSGLVTLSNGLLKTAIIFAGLYSLWNFIAAGYGFMSAGDDAKAVGKAFDKFWQSLLGLTFVAGAFVLAGVFGYLILGDTMAFISPTIYGPGAAYCP